jgi:hypothetical protein
MALRGIPGVSRGMEWGVGWGAGGAQGGLKATPRTAAITTSGPGPALPRGKERNAGGGPAGF